MSSYRPKRKDLVTLKIARKLKVLGYETLCECFYGYKHSSEEEINPYDFLYTEVDSGYSDNSNKFRTSAPTRNKAAKWITKKFGHYLEKGHNKQYVSKSDINWALNDVIRTRKDSSVSINENK